MSKCYLLFAEGLEECEGLITLDILRRAGLEAYTVSIQEAHTVVGAHGVPITCDRTLPELLAAPPELVVLPGGMPGTTNLAKSPAVEALVRRTLEHGGRAAAICAAPSVLAQYGLLAGRRATCYPGFESRVHRRAHGRCRRRHRRADHDRPRPRRGDGVRARARAPAHRRADRRAHGRGDRLAHVTVDNARARA